MKQQLLFQLIDMDNRLFNATTTFNIVGFGMYDGKYIIDKATHSISSGYRISIEAHKVNINDR